MIINIQRPSYYIIMYPSLRVLFFFSFMLSSQSLHISGIFKYNDINKDHTDWKNFVKYLGKFGVNKGSTVYMYGNASRITYSNPYSNMIILFAPSSKWKETINAVEKPKHEISNYRCNNTLVPIFGSSCEHSSDYYRTVPCGFGRPTCENQPSQPKPPKYSQFGYVESVSNTEYWYVFLMYCGRNRSVEPCDWDYTQHFDFSYSFSIVNSDPDDSHLDPITYQFPANYQGVMITYILFSFLYAFLIPTHLIMNSKLCNGKQFKSHKLVWMFSAALIFEALNILSGLIHFSVYATNGVGVIAFFYLKDAFNLIGDWFLILVLILISGGWQVTRRSIKWKYASFPIFVIYVIISGIYYIWEVVYLEYWPWETNDPLQTWAGGLYLAVRSILLFYVWYQIFHIYRQEETFSKLRLYKILAVLFTIWFWYLPLLVFIVTFINPVTRGLILLDFGIAMNFIANLIMAALFCPKWSHEYFQFDSTVDKMITVSTNLQTLKTYSRLQEENSDVI